MIAKPVTNERRDNAVDVVDYHQWRGAKYAWTAANDTKAHRAR